MADQKSVKEEIKYFSENVRSLKSSKDGKLFNKSEKFLMNKLYESSIKGLELANKLLELEENK